MAVIVGNSQAKYEMQVSGDAKDIRINIGDAAIQASKTQTQEVMDTVGKTATKVIESGGSIITAPAVWLKNIQENWLLYMVVAAIILSCIVFLYCAFCYYLNNKKNNWANNNLIELAKVIGNKDGALQRQLALPINNVPHQSSDSILHSNV